MRTIPNAGDAAIRFFEQRHALWEGHAEQIGLTEDDLAALEPLIEGARSSHAAAARARQASRDATLALKVDLKRMRSKGGGLVMKIRAFAEATGDPGVYALAGIPAPPAPAPLPSPTPPERLAARLNNDGHVVLTWTATRLNGEFFSVWRLLPDDTWAHLGSVNAKRFVDRTLALGHPWAQYRVVSHRGSDASESTEPIAVLFGPQAKAA
jgi:hypothetical protein